MTRESGAKVLAPRAAHLSDGTFDGTEAAGVIRKLLAGGQRREARMARMDR